MSRLRELFGVALDEPDGRFELELALRLRPFAALAGDAGETAEGQPAGAGAVRR